MNSENQTSWSQNFLWHNWGSLINVTLSERSESQYPSESLRVPSSNNAYCAKVSNASVPTKKWLRPFTLLCYKDHNTTKPSSALFRYSPLQIVTKKSSMKMNFWVQHFQVQKLITTTSNTDKHEHKPISIAGCFEEVLVISSTSIPWEGKHKCQ